MGQRVNDQALPSDLAEHSERRKDSPAAPRGGHDPLSPCQGGYDEEPAGDRDAPGHH
jgi:hypothetical protein